MTKPDKYHDCGHKLRVADKRRREPKTNGDFSQAAGSVYFGDTAYPVIASLSGGYYLAAHPNGPCVCGNGYISTIHAYDDDDHQQLRAVKNLAAEKFREWAWPQLVGQFHLPNVKPSESPVEKPKI